MHDLIQLSLIWCCVYLSALAANKTKLTPVLFFLAFGSLMVNIGLMPEQSSEFIINLGELGIIVIMFALGFEENPNNFVSGIKKAWGIAFFGALAPFATAYFIADYLWSDTNISILFGLTMTATAVSLTMVSLKSEGLNGSPAATGIMTSAVLDDIASLAMLAILVPLASGNGDVSVASVALIAAKVVIFFALISFIGIWIFPKSERGWFSKIPVLGRFSFGDLMNFGHGEYATLTVLLLAVLAGLLAHEFGFHPAIGAYMAGLILREEYFLLGDSKNNNDFFKETARIVDNVAYTWLGPVFFVVLGSKLVFDGAMFISVLPQTVLLTVSIIIAQITSAALAARYTAGFNNADSLLIGLGMLGRAELAFVVMDIAYTEHHIFTTEVFYILMFTAFWLNAAVPLSIRHWKKYFMSNEIKR